jgi:hypothetical protein
MRVSWLVNTPLVSSDPAPLLDELAMLGEWGITGVTVADLELCRRVAARFPALQIRVSTIAHVATPQRVQAFTDAGAHEIHLSWDLNRELRLLEGLVSGSAVPLSLLVNDGCVHHCERRSRHYRSISRQLEDERGARPGVSDEAFSRRCAVQRLRSPEEILLSPFIRPEDLAVYEELGIERFKVVGRTKASGHILRMVGAYQRRSSPENLVDILDLAGSPGLGAARVRELLLRDDSLGRASARALIATARLMSLGAGLGRRVGLEPPRLVQALAGLQGLPPSQAARRVAVGDQMGRFAEIYRLRPHALDGFLEAWQGVRGDEARRELAREWAQRALVTEHAARRRALGIIEQT